MSGPRLRLFFLSFLMLFVELALIRWTSSDVVYLSYFTNFILLGSFLGIGIGFLRSKSERNLFPYTPIALAALVLLVVFAPPAVKASTNESLYYQSPGATGLPIWLMLPIIFLLSAIVMEMIGEGVARQFATFEPLEAYRLDILGSLAGIAVFTLLSFLGAPPIAWGLVAASVYLGLEVQTLAVLKLVQMIQVIAVVVLLGGLIWESVQPNTFWSPYHKIELKTEPGGTRAWLDGTPHQIINSAPNSYAALYSLPYELRSSTQPPRNVLVIGAGTGPDVAVALAKGASHVDAVEIDPRLVKLGRDLNPDHPFQDLRVSVFATDGRAFLEKTDRIYDLILFALPDSLVLVAGQSSLRLESYLFTEQAIALAKAHLALDGVFALYNYFRETWVVDRLAGEIRDVFGNTPCYEIEGDQGHTAQLTVGLDPRSVSCPDTLWNPNGAVVAPATDDHPFIYIRGRTVPGFYLLTIALILAIALVAVRGSAGPLPSMRPYVDLFFMGAGFLLLETRNVVTFALLFGTTWLVNALVFFGILLAVLAAIEVARRLTPQNPGRWYVGLLAALIVAWAVPASWLLTLPFAQRFVVASAVAFAPVFLANLVFAERFRDVASSTTAFGANLLGAMVGGLLEYGAIVVGYRGLLIVAAVVYGAAFLLGRRATPSTVPARPARGKTRAISKA
jgi:spermidine synthase